MPRLFLRMRRKTGRPGVLVRFVPHTWALGLMLMLMPGLAGLMPVDARAQEQAKAQEQEEQRPPKVSPQEQLRSGFGDLLGFRGEEDAAAAVLLEKAVGPIFRELEVRGTQLNFVDEGNAAGTITASRPSHESAVVRVAIDKKQIATTYADAAERVEMTWFALLHELQNALRAKEFKELALKGWRGEMSEEEFVRGELSTEWDSLTAAYDVYVRVVWPELGALGLEPKGRVQRDYKGIENFKKEDAVSQHVSGPMGAYYRERYAEYAREREARRKKREAAKKE
jgi:hypothetical protein